MTEQRTNVSPYVMRAETLRDRVRSLAQASANIRWSHHARERMQERGITNRAALFVLQEGEIVGQIEPGASPGEWKAKIVRMKKGQRGVGVVCIVIRDHSIFVKTVEWEDPK